MTDPANEVQTKETITKKMRVSADRAWDAIRQFGRLDVWFLTMIECRIEGEGAGAWRYLTLDGGLGSITDRLVELYEDDRRLTYERTESPFPVKSYIGNVEVFSSFDSLGVVAWTIDFESELEVSEAVSRCWATDDMKNRIRGIFVRSDQVFKSDQPSRREVGPSRLVAIRPASGLHLLATGRS